MLPGLVKKVNVSSPALPRAVTAPAPLPAGKVKWSLPLPPSTVTSPAPLNEMSRFPVAAEPSELAKLAKFSAVEPAPIVRFWSPTTLILFNDVKFTSKSRVLAPQRC